MSKSLSKFFLPTQWLYLCSACQTELSLLLLLSSRVRSVFGMQVTNLGDGVPLQ